MDGAARTFRIGALAHRNFRLFFYGQGISLIGSWMQSVALGWLVLDLTNSAFAVGLNQALRSLGVLLCTLYAGIVVDRVDKRRLIVLTQALQMAEATARRIVAERAGTVLRDLRDLRRLGVVTTRAAGFLTIGGRRCADARWAEQMMFWGPDDDVGRYHAVYEVSPGTFR